jgi:hypothetical protein
MTYQVSSIAAISEIPALLKTFADSLGFTTTTVSGTQVTVKHPSYTPAKIFTVQSLTSGTGATLREQISVSTNAAGSTAAICESPKMNPSQVNSGASVVVSAPTKLHLFGKLAGGASDSGETFIAGVIEYGYNLYRHFYMGYIEKISAFDNGELVTGSAFWPVGKNSNSAIYCDTDDTRYPFSANNAVNGDAGNGGAYIVNAGNATPWRSFSSGTWTSGHTFDQHFATYCDSLILGGYKDNMNSGYMGVGKSPYSGAQLLAPINLYIGKKVSTTAYFQAVGSAAGARLVHMEDLEPGAAVTIGTQTWRVFPVFQKSLVTSYSTSISTAANAFPAGNSSYLVGMAYKVSD